MPRRKPKRRAEAGVLSGFAWYDHAQYQRLLGVADDRDELDDTFDDWHRVALRALKEFSRQGFAVQKVLVDVEELVLWCKEQGYKNDSEARTRYVLMRMKRFHEETKLQG
ncbi:MAG TPA: hypothetical protein VGY53_10520, partial [Isosphaeraceae bacterium]|nr:hypothetical protein [Isosphaeraceae bacterium]